jgi:intein/homing endonuclease
MSKCLSKPLSGMINDWKMEMNVFLSQSIQTQIELEEIADVKRQIISPATSRTSIGIVQDGLIGSYNLTSPNMMIDRKNAMNIVSYTSLDDFSAFKKKEDYTGYEIFSMIIPSKINVKRGEGDKALIIKNGILEKGYMTKDLLGSKKKNNLTQLIWDEYGMDETKNFLNNTQRLINNFNLYNGFTVGVGDAAITKEVDMQINKLFETKDLKVNHMVTDLENNPDLMDTDLLEKSIFGELNVIREEVGKIMMKNIAPENNFNIMISCGSKGDATNLGQMGGCVGLQAFEGKLMPKKIHDRSIPYFFKDEDSSESRGLIKRPFIAGTTFPEFFFHNMTGREGLIDQAIKSVTGDTPIVIIENDKPKHVMIGDWIDNILSENTKDVKHYEDRDMELLNIPEKKLYVPTSDEDGKVTWGEITAIIRHDPGNELYEIKTLGGRKVIVTESKSLLIWNKEEKKFLHTLTPEVKIGDYMPVTMKLTTPPIINKYVDMIDYFPKNKFVYGTDFIMATNKMNEAMKGREHIYPGWWNKENGTSFTLPYSKVASLRRTNVRSNITNIKEGHVYAFQSTREHVLIPDKFELNRDNGVFIGLYLSEGCISKQHIGISNNEIEIQEFVKNWFNKFSINSCKRSEINKIGGLSETITGCSSILSQFLIKTCSHGAKHKYVPDYAFTAPDEFIIGLIDGYISGDGTITENSVEVGSASERLINGISMLCSRLGIFGKVSKTIIKSNNLGTKDIAPRYTLAIRGQWGSLFSQKITLTEQNKNKRLMKIRILSSHKNFTVQNDVVLDAITEINKVDVKLYPKVYDLTVPSTLNFGLANGLHVVDTSQSGYIQHKLIKLMEDYMIKYDGTARSALNQIIQFVYGDSGADTTRQYEYTMKMLELGDKEIAEKHKFTDEELKHSGLTKQENEEIYQEILGIRDKLRVSQIKTRMNWITMNTTYMLPVNIDRIVENNKNDAKLKAGKGTIDAKYVISKFVEILDNKNTQLLTMKNSERQNKESIKYKDDRVAKTSLVAALYDLLSPKRCMIEYNFTKEQLDEIASQIIKAFNKNLIEPGEMVGIIAAQSLGEPVKYRLVL